MKQREEPAVETSAFKQTNAYKSHTISEKLIETAIIIINIPREKT